MSKTYKKNSMHNKYSPKLTCLNLRVDQQLRLRIEKYAERHGMGLAEACRHIFTEAVNDIPLDAEDFMEIAKRMKDKEERNAKRG